MVDVLRCCLTGVHIITFFTDKPVYLKLCVNKHQQIMINNTLLCLSQMTVSILFKKYCNIYFVHVKVASCIYFLNINLI